jgi:hypothetical protein
MNMLDFVYTWVCSDVIQEINLLQANLVLYRVETWRPLLEESFSLNVLLNVEIFLNKCSHHISHSFSSMMLFVTTQFLGYYVINCFINYLWDTTWLELEVGVGLGMFYSWSYICYTVKCWTNIPGAQVPTEGEKNTRRRGWICWLF